MSGQPKLVVGIELDERYLARLRDAAPAAEFVVATHPDVLRVALADADALIGAWSLDAGLLDAAPRLRWIQATGAGVERILNPELLLRDIVLTNLSGVHAPNIAEHVLAMMLAFARGLPTLFRDQLRHVWRGDHEEALPRFELAGQTLLVAGLGDIGDALARRADGLGMRVIATRRRPESRPPYVARLLPPAGLAELLPEADHVALCLPLTPATRQIMNVTMLGLLRPTAYLYNIGRGDLLDQESLLVALREGRLAGAGLDVTSPEPLPADSPLWDLPNVIVTAHTSGHTPRYWDRGIEIVADNVRRFLAGEPLHNVVDQVAGY